MSQLDEEEKAWQRVQAEKNKLAEMCPEWQVRDIFEKAAIAILDVFKTNRLDWIRHYRDELFRWHSEVGNRLFADPRYCNYDEARDEWLKLHNSADSGERTDGGE